MRKFSEMPLWFRIILSPIRLVQILLYVFLSLFLYIIHSDLEDTLLESIIVDGEWL